MQWVAGETTGSGGCYSETAPFNPFRCTTFPQGASQIFLHRRYLTQGHCNYSEPKARSAKNRTSPSAQRTQYARTLAISHAERPAGQTMQENKKDCWANNAAKNLPKRAR